VVLTRTDKESLRARFFQAFSRVKRRARGHFLVAPPRGAEGRTDDRSRLPGALRDGRTFSAPPSS
jgi:hypothetical protein